MLDAGEVEVTHSLQKLVEVLAVHLGEDADGVGVEAPGELRLLDADVWEADPGLGSAQILAQLTRAPVTGADLERLIWLSKLLAHNLLLGNLTTLTFQDS